jgi:hypothetical protein
MAESLDQAIPEWPRVLEIMATADNLVAQASGEAQESPEVRAGFKKWATCMDGFGYDYTDPWQPTDDYPSDKPTDDEKSTAVASAKCMHSSGLLRDWSRVEAANTAELLKEATKMLDEWTSLQKGISERRAGTED